MNLALSERAVSTRRSFSPRNDRGQAVLRWLSLAGARDERAMVATKSLPGSAFAVFTASSNSRNQPLSRSPASGSAQRRKRVCCQIE